MPEVITTDEFRAWYEPLSQEEQDPIYKAVVELERRGVALGFPQSSAIQNSRYPLRELRVQSKGKPIRIFYCFDPQRDAVLLLGGDKTGDNRFYERMVPMAEKIWEQYLAEERGG